MKIYVLILSPGRRGMALFPTQKVRLPHVIRYILNQGHTSPKANISGECRQFLTVFEIEWDEQYIFKELE